MLDSSVRSAAAGLTYRPFAGLSTSFDGRGDDTRTRQFTLQGRGVDGSVSYERPLPLGVAQASYAARYDERTQKAAATQTNVIGERIALVGTGYVTLGHAHIVAGSITVSNAARTQTFAANIDYAISTVGNETRLQRLIGGNILDGEPLLVDYAWNTGGTFAYSEQAQTVNLSWGVSRFFNVFVRYLQSAPRIITGASTFPLNEVNSRTVGMRTDIPLHAGIAFTLGGSVEIENRRETIAPFRRETADVYGQTDESVFGLGQFRLSLRRSRVDYGNSQQDLNLQGYDLRYWSREWFGIDLTAAANYERDDSGLLPRQRFDRSIGAQWRQRKFTLNTSLVTTREVQGGNERARTVFQFLARREL